MGNEYDFAKVLDFGLVKILEDGDQTQMTVPGATTGTPSYMAPELALASPHIDGRTDLYGLGCVAYWLVTGSLVFEERSSTAMILAHMHKVPVPPSKRVELEIPASLDRAIMMCLAKEPAHRPADAETLTNMLDNCDDVDLWTPQDAESWWRSNMPADTVHVHGDPKPAAAESKTYPTL